MFSRLSVPFCLLLCFLYHIPSSAALEPVAIHRFMLSKPAPNLKPVTDLLYFSLGGSTQVKSINSKIIQLESFFPYRRTQTTATSAVVFRMRFHNSKKNSQVIAAVRNVVHNDNWTNLLDDSSKYHLRKFGPKRFDVTVPRRN